MNKRQIKKIIKLYSDLWWGNTSNFINDEGRDITAYALIPPAKWNTAKILKAFHAYRYNEADGLYWYRVSV